MSYQQKSLWLQLVGYAAPVTYYLMTHHDAGTILMFAAIQIVGQLLIRATGGKEPKDERDNLIEAKSYRAGYLLLVLGIIVCMNLPAHPVATGPFLLVLLVGEVSKAITQLLYYQRGA